MIRLTGVALVLFSCCLFSVKLHLQMEEDFREWCLFQGILLEIRRNNRQACAVMADLLQEALKSIPDESAVASATEECLIRLRQRKMPMEWIWEQYIERIHKQLHFPTALLIQAKRLGRVISHKDSETIERYLESVLALVSEEIAQYSKNMKTKDVVRSSLCIMAGMMTILLLI